jgi:hypothetical protein
MKSRDTTLLVLAGVATVSLASAFLPRHPTNVEGPHLDVPAILSSASSGPAGLGSIDGILAGSTGTIVAKGHAGHGHTLTVSRTEALTINGWALGEDAQRGSMLVYRVDSGPWLSAEYGVSRPDVAQSMHRSDVAACGFFARVPIATVAPGRHALVFALLVSGNRLETIDDPLPLVVR